ncbi:signal peptidase II [Treponema zioleckii]|uniref:signal peptidase II n=1 Tax=Treponema zioleckii TaxID=331680 RepID=UPI00168B0AD6|nr:signal peptidase II [Treponema zioleckii]
MSSNTITVEFKPKYPKAKKIVPLLLVVLVIIADQITKYLVAKNIPYYTEDPRFLIPELHQDMMNNFLNLIYICNKGIAFSIGQGWATNIRGFLFVLIPIIVLFVVLGIYIKNDSFTQLQRWAIAGIAGGGFGNLIDRIMALFNYRKGVVDFIDVKFYGIFGYERWPTFNVADSAVVVCGVLLVISFIFTIKNEHTKGDE